MPTNHAAIYLRVPTYYQSEELSCRRTQLEHYCQKDMKIPDYVIFEEVVRNDRTIDRPAFQELHRRLRQEEFSHLLVWKLEDLYHGYEKIEVFLTELKDYGIILQSIVESSDHAL